jgi:DNA primase
VLEAAVNFYHQRLLGHPRALAYLQARGIDRQTIDRYQLGYASGEQLLSVLWWRGVPLRAAFSTGLVNRYGYEHLAGRIVFPELRQRRPVWLIGRSLEATAEHGPPKYLGLPGRKPLFGWDEASAYRSVCVVEGVLDMLVLRQWGYPTVALLGTGVRPDQVDQLRTFARVYLVLDNDRAGHEATLILHAAIGPTVVPVTLPDGIKDPAELARRLDGQALFAAALLQSAGFQATQPATTRRVV